MLRTCIGTDASVTKEYVSPNPRKTVTDNGDIFRSQKETSLLADILPEEIPGLPRHRPGNYSPRSVP